MSREHPCAIDSHRVREQDHSVSLYPASFIWMAHQILSGAHGSEPKESLEDKTLPVRFALSHSLWARKLPA